MIHNKAHLGSQLIWQVSGEAGLPSGVEHLLHVLQHLCLPPIKAGHHCHLCLGRLHTAGIRHRARLEATTAAAATEFSVTLIQPSPADRTLTAGCGSCLPFFLLCGGFMASCICAFSFSRCPSASCRRTPQATEIHGRLLTATECARGITAALPRASTATQQHCKRT